MTAGRTGGDAELRRRAKAMLRRQMKAVRDALPESASKQRSAKIADQLRTVEELDAAETLLAFSSIRSEVDTAATIGEAWAKGRRVALPRVIDAELELRLVASDTVLVEGAFGVAEPPDDAPEVRPEEVDFALLPALAVDPRGYRVGYGGGYYDRLIPKLTRAFVCVVAYQFQLVSEIPDQPFDAKADLVVTDERVIRPA